VRLSTRLAGIAGAAIVLTPGLIFATITPVTAAVSPPPAVQIFGVRSECTNDTDEYTITWTLTTQSPDPVDIEVLDAEPTGPLHVAPSSGQVKAGQDLVLVHDVNAHAGPSASVAIRVSPPGGVPYEASSAQFGVFCDFGPEVQVRGVGSCDADGHPSVTWTLVNSGPASATVVLDAAVPLGSTITEAFPLTLDGGTSTDVHQSIPGTFVSGTASVGFTATNPAVKGLTPATVPGIANFGCTAPTTPPASTEAGGGQAPADLADTGSPTLTYAGIAGLLIAAGIGLLLLGRRHRRTS